MKRTLLLAMMIFGAMLFAALCPAQQIVASAPANDRLAQSGVAVKFSYSESADYKPVTFMWDFKDGLHGTGNPCSHNFTHAGTFDVLLVTDDGHGNQRNYHQVVKINRPVEFLALAPSE